MGKRENLFCRGSFFFIGKSYKVKKRSAWDAHSRVQGKCCFRNRARRESPQADSLFFERKSVEAKGIHSTS